MGNIVPIEGRRTSFDQSQARTACRFFGRSTQLVGWILVEHTDVHGRVVRAIRDVCHETRWKHGCVGDSIAELAGLPEDEELLKLFKASDVGPLLLRDEKITCMFDWNRDRIDHLVGLVEARDLAWADSRRRKRRTVRGDAHPLRLTAEMLERRRTGLSRMDEDMSSATEDRDAVDLKIVEGAFKETRAATKRYRVGRVNVGTTPPTSFAALPELKEKDAKFLLKTIRDGHAHYQVGTLREFAIVCIEAFYASDGTKGAMRSNGTYEFPEGKLVHYKHPWSYLAHELAALETDIHRRMMWRINVPRTAASTPPPAPPASSPTTNPVDQLLSDVAVRVGGGAR